MPQRQRSRSHARVVPFPVQSAPSPASEPRPTAPQLTPAHAELRAAIFAIRDRYDIPCAFVDDRALRVHWPGSARPFALLIAGCVAPDLAHAGPQLRLSTLLLPTASPDEATVRRATLALKAMAARLALSRDAGVTARLVYRTWGSGARMVEANRRTVAACPMCCEVGQAEMRERERLADRCRWMIAAEGTGARVFAVSLGGGAGDLRAM